MDTFQKRGLYFECSGYCWWKKYVLLVSYYHKEGYHDSNIFKATRLYDHLKKVSAKLIEKGYIILGDSAYCIELFLLQTYDNVAPRSSDDYYNFYHSSARITIECAFGEIDAVRGVSL